MRLNLMFFILFLLPVLGCLKANEEQGELTDSSSSFSNITSGEIQEAYVLQVVSWEVGEDGLSVFTHLIEDAYRGLEVISSTTNPVRDLTVQLGKDIQNFQNLLSVGGTFDANQSLRMKLPFSLFSLDSIFLTDTSIDYSRYVYRFVPDGSASPVDITADVTADGAYVSLEQFGTVIVQPLCEDGTVQTAASCDSDSSSNQLTINSPSLDFRFYHDVRDELRTFSWANANNEAAECSLNGGTDWAACTSTTDHLVSVSDFNNKGVFKVRLAGGAEGEVNLSTLYPDVTFFQCSLPFEGNGTLAGFGGSKLDTPGTVICVEPNALIESNGPAVKINANNVIIIGDHIDRATIKNSATSAGSNDDGAAIMYATGYTTGAGAILANLKIESTAGGASGAALYLANSIGSPGFTILSNVDVGANADYAIFQSGNHGSEVYNSVIKRASGTGPVVKVNNGLIQVYDSKLINSGTGKVIDMPGQGFSGFSVLKDSVLISDNSMAVELGSDVDLDPIVFNVENTYFKTNGSTFTIGQDSTLNVSNSAFISSANGAASGYVFDKFTSPAGALTITGNNNQYCELFPSFGFEGLMESTVTTANSGNTVNLTGVVNCPLAPF